MSIVKETAGEVIAATVSSDRVGYTVATGTIFMGVTFADLQTIGSLLATYGGILLTLILAIKHVIDTVIKVKTHLRRKDDNEIDS